MTGNQDPRLTRLRHLAELVHQADLSRLAKAKRAAEAAHSGLQALSRPSRDVEDFELQQVRLTHDAWAAKRIRALDEEIARLEALTTGLRKTAARSLARNQVLDERSKVESGGRYRINRPDA